MLTVAIEPSLLIPVIQATSLRRAVTKTFVFAVRVVSHLKKALRGYCLNSKPISPQNPINLEVFSARFLNFQVSCQNLVSSSFSEDFERFELSSLGYLIPCPLWVL